ncbi:hypothetical protein EG850_10915 [Gulosibacter macacae]|uniref:Uncharacterized protein n=1 Tax=Gulosibacter macacae TaxID=2488791 RepID=A0A3P3VSX4_9MICO|nr:hypothetical protein [Gulosibacter macacae]RRJ85892.1 hypothetical protein EG850_10915 [Gulosibacter macacae]
MPIDPNVIVTAVISAVVGIIGLLTGRGNAKAQAAKAAAEALAAAAAADASKAATAAEAAQVWKTLYEEQRDEFKGLKDEFRALSTRVEELEQHRDDSELLRGFIARAHRYYRGGGTVPYPVPPEVARIVWPELYVEALSSGAIAIGEHIDDRPKETE